MTSQQINVQHFKGPNFENNAKECVKFITEQELKRDQIVSINQQETQIETGESWIALFYRTHAINEEATPFEEIQFKKLNSLTNWQVQGKQLESILAEEPMQIVAVTHTPRHVMELRNQLVWFSKTSPAKVTVKYLKAEDGNWDELIRRCSKYINSYIAPHQLIDIDFFEESHPNKKVDGDFLIYCTIVHTAGDEPVCMDEKKSETMPAKFFTTKTFTSNFNGDEIETPYKQAVEAMNSAGWDQGHVVSAFNMSAPEDASEDDQFYGAVRVVVFSWQRIYEQAMEDVLRPNSCMANCTIF